MQYSALPLAPIVRETPANPYTRFEAQTARPATRISSAGRS